MDKPLLCKLNLHLWETDYDVMYEKYSRVCSKCGHEQVESSRTLTIKYEDKPLKKLK
jgi:hypothetical protein